MPARAPFEYSVIRVVPDVVREELVNAGVVVFCPAHDVLVGAVELDAARLGSLAPEVDLAFVEAHLGAIVRICRGGPDAGPMGALPTAERFRWLTAPRNTMIQLSPPHAGLCEDAKGALERLMQTMVRSPTRSR